jgi:hypothetical protein
VASSAPLSQSEVPQPAAAPPARSMPPAGGVVGGVLGGVPPGRLETISNDTRVGTNRGATDARPATPSPPPPPPPPVAKAAGAAPAPEAGSPSARVLFEALPVQLSFAAAEEKKERSAAPAAPAVMDKARRDAAPARTLAGAASSVAPLAPVPHLGVRYSAMRRAPGGQYTEVDPSTVFVTREPLRLLFEPNDTGYLYVLQREAGGGWRQLYGEEVQRRSRVQVPSTGALAYDEPGAKELYAVFSRRPEPAFANLQPAMLDQRLRGSLLLQKSPEKALYIVNTSSTPQSQQVAFAITLSVRQP